jgi:hypothetical protein
MKKIIRFEYPSTPAINIEQWHADKHQYIHTFFPDSFCFAIMSSTCDDVRVSIVIEVSFNHKFFSTGKKLEPEQFFHLNLKSMC